jgi:hypothetical protein
LKRKVSSAVFVAYLTACFSLLVIAPASAYIDPGSGSIIFQAVVGGAMAIGLTVKVFWRRITTFFSRKRS